MKKKIAAAVATLFLMSTASVMAAPATDIFNKLKLMEISVSAMKQRLNLPTPQRTGQTRTDGVFGLMLVMILMKKSVLRGVWCMASIILTRLTKEADFYGINII